MILGAVSGAVAGAGAKNAKGFQKMLFGDKGWNKAMSSMYKVTGKIAQGGYTTVQGMKGALNIVNRNISIAYANALKSHIAGSLMKAFGAYVGSGVIGFIINNVVGW